MTVDPYVDTCRALAQARVPYVIVGVFGINLHASRVGIVITTADCDVMLPPDVPALRRALRVMHRLKFLFEVGGEPFVGDHPDDLAAIVRNRAVVRAYRGDTHIDLTLQIAGFNFGALWARRKMFRVSGIPLKVAPLEALVRSKELANRPKDRLFLETYKDAIAQMWPQRRRS